MLASHLLETHNSLLVSRFDWPAPTPLSCAREAELIEALADEDLSRRFRCWRGQSGQRYIFSVFDSGECPAYGDAVLIAAAVEPDGTRRPIAVEDTGSLPEPLLSRLARHGLALGRRVEFHVHLLARTAAERRDIVNDLAPAVEATGNDRSVGNRRR